MVRNRLIGLIMKIILPVCFITLKFTGSFIDFMLGLANANVQEDNDIVITQVRDSRNTNHGSNLIELISSLIDYRYRESYETAITDFAVNGSSTAKDSLVTKGSSTLKNLLGKNTVKSFKFRTCVKPKLSEIRNGEAEITYQSLTAQDLLLESLN